MFGGLTPFCPLSPPPVACSDQVQTLDDVFAEMAVLDSRRTWAAGKLVLFLRTIFKRRRQRVRTTHTTANGRHRHTHYA